MARDHRSYGSVQKSQQSIAVNGFPDVRFTLEPTPSDEMLGLLQVVTAQKVPELRLDRLKIQPGKTLSF